MSGLPRRTRTAARCGVPQAAGPDAEPVQVLESFERAGHEDPAAAWHAFTRTWNWAAPLPAAVPGDDGAAGLVARPVAGGFSLSGQWRVPTRGVPRRWLALPLTDVREAGGQAAADDPDLFVVSTKVLPRPSGQHHGGDRARAPGPEYRLDGVYVPAGFATRSRGGALRADAAAFHWTAVTAMALGVARRLTDTLTAPAPLAAAGLTALLRDERASLATALREVSNATRDGAPDTVEKLAAQVGRTARAVHHVVAAAYEGVPTAVVRDGRHPLTCLIDSGTPILQHVRYAVDLHRPDDSAVQEEGRPW
ncbi:hypothetical protein AB0A94_03085 [Streptomyces sp. NPDC044984]|uniref:hypothetical protein n=1 Tax=Streptomyces sp. NPDC044984 TaxID=3154335 RepID=UPI0033C7D5B3